MRRFFANFATRSAYWMGHPFAFIVAVLSCVIWAATGPLFHYSDTWQLVINTATTIVTFLMVALLQNSQSRSEDAIHQKLDAIADALADMMETSRDANGGMRADVDDLRKAVGIEQVEGKETANA